MPDSRRGGVAVAVLAIVATWVALIVFVLVPLVEAMLDA
jgi:hypothetical protein